MTANTAAYQAAMAKAAASTRSFSSDSTRNLTQLGGSMQSVGRTMSLGVTAPLIALGAGAVSMAAKFDTAFAQMVGLANVPAGEVDALRESVLSLAGETAVAPQELADGLFFAASAGLDAAAAMDAVSIAARASAAGMGSTKDVVGLVASAVASYGEANITAAEATDILTSTIREGRAEPAELASTLGRVLPIAADLGVSFDDVGASVALLTNVFGDTNRAVTAFQGVMVKLSSPTEQGRDALADFGLTVEDIKAAISQDGLLGALELLQTSGLAGSAEAMAALFDDIEGRQGALALLNTDAETLNSTFEALDNSAGSLDTAFNAVSDTAGFKMKQAMTDIKVAMIQVGEILLPLAADVASTISGMIGWFSDLSPAVQELVVVFGGLAAAAGPAIFVAGSLVKNWAAVSTALAGVSPATAGVVRALGAVAIVATVAYTAWQILGEGHLNASAHIDTASGALVREVPAAFAAAVAAGEATTAVDALAIAHVALSNAIAASADEELGGAFARLNVASVDWLDTLVALNGHWGYTTGQLDFFTVRAQLAEQALGLLSGEGEIFIGVLDEGGHSVEELANITGTSVTEMQSFLDALALVSLYALESTGEIDEMSLSFLNVQNDMGGAARQALLLAENIAGSRFEVGNATAVYQEFVKQLALLTPAQREAVFSTDAYQGALASLPPEMQALISGTEDLTGATEELAMVQASSIDTMSLLQETWEAIDKRVGIYGDALDRVLGGSRDWIRTHLDNADALADFADNIDDASAGLDTNTEAGRDNVNAVLDMADALLSMTQANIDSNKPLEQTTAEYVAGREALIETAKAAGLNEQAIDDLITAYGLTPELITTTVDIAGEALATWAIQRHIAKLDKIDPVVATEIEAAINIGDWAEAERLIEQYTRDQTVGIYVKVLNTPVVKVAYQGNLYQSAAGRFIPGGSNLITSTAERGGSAGDEVILPLGDRSRMAALLGMSEVGPRVAAALGRLTPYSSPMMSGSAMAGSGVAASSVVNVIVNMPPGANGDDVVRALKQWQRRSGPLPLAVR